MIAKNTLEVGLTEDGTEIVINHPDLQPDANGVGHIVFSPAQALGLADTLYNKVYEVKAPPLMHAMDPRKMREDSMLWARAKFPAVAVGRYREAADFIQTLKTLLADVVKGNGHVPLAELARIAEIIGAPPPPPRGELTQCDGPDSYE